MEKDRARANARSKDYYQRSGYRERARLRAHVYRHLREFIEDSSEVDLEAVQLKLSLYTGTAFRKRTVERLLRTTFSSFNQR